MLHGYIQSMVEVDTMLTTKLSLNWTLVPFLLTQAIYYGYWTVWCPCVSICFKAPPNIDPAQNGINKGMIKCCCLDMGFTNERALFNQIWFVVNIETTVWKVAESNHYNTAMINYDNGAFNLWSYFTWWDKMAEAKYIKYDIPSLGSIIKPDWSH